MTKKPNGRLLLTWNEKKHPEIVKFFDSIEEGLYSHSVREAIKFYMKHHKTHENNPESPLEGVQGGSWKELKDRPSQDIKPRKSVENDEYEEFNPRDL